MRSVMKRICLSLAVIAVLIFTGCGQKKTKDPITVTLWHVYGGQTESPLNDLIDQFNETIGKEENIWVQVGSVTNTNTIHENVLASAFGDPGASELPDMFVSYPKTVLAMPDDTVLVDYCDYFTKEELDEIKMAGWTIIANRREADIPAQLAFWLDEHSPQYRKLNALTGEEKGRDKIAGYDVESVIKYPGK